MQKQVFYTITKNVPLTREVFQMDLQGDTSCITAPGQFINIRLDGKFLRRPISVCDWNAAGLTIIYKVVGAGTQQMSEMAPGTVLDTLSGLGNGYTLHPAEKPLVIGGGVGVPPLYALTKALLKAGQKPQVILGFNTAGEVFYEKEFRALGVPVTVATADGSRGVKGFVTDAFPQDYDYFYTCGPMPMFLAIEKIAQTSGQFSFEERMGCGFGACMGCSCKTKDGYKRICVDGPVLEREEIVWQTFA